MVLQPARTSYPPGVQARLDARPNRILIPNDAITEIITDGRSFDLLQQSYSSDVSRQQR
jgi:hypothetical protein